MSQVPAVLCRKCSEREVPPGRIRHRKYVCSRCENAAPERQRRIRAHRTKYNHSAKGQAANAERWHRRIWVGSDYHSIAASAEQAAAIQAHIRERMHVFKQGQSSRAAMEADPTDAISA